MALTALTGFVSLGVDWGHVQLVKLELQRAADAAARSAASTIPSGPSAARASAIATAGQNTVDYGNTSVSVAAADVEFGSFDPVTKSFNAYAGAAEASASAVRVTARRTVTLWFTGLLGLSSRDVVARSVTSYTPPLEVVNDVPGTSNLWLAGMPDGTVASLGNPHNNPDYAPTASPSLVNGIPLVEGQALAFDSISGGANNGQSTTRIGPDGNTGQTVSNFCGNELGKSNVTAPINSVIAVFLDDQLPTSAGSTPPSLDFSTAASRDFASLSPQLRQPFFVGDGLRADGSTQSFVVPRGATRLFIGTMDSYEWNNNVGRYTTAIRRIAQVRTVK
jgi:Flp pilus assembly protein TadG